MKKIFIFLANSVFAGFFVVGCALNQLKDLYISTPFNVAEASIINKQGKNTISGSALIKRNDGQAVTCSGGKVELIPYTTYANTRILSLYGGSERGFRPVYESTLNQIKFIPDTPEYYDMRKSAQCNAQGFFVFKNIADGDYFVTTNVVWMAGNYHQGGSLMKRVAVKGGESVDIVLSP